MKAAVLFDSPGKFSIEDITMDAPAPHEVVVDLVASGLCHSDLHFLRGELAVPMPAVLGHEERRSLVRQVGSSDVTSR